MRTPWRSRRRRRSFWKKHSLKNPPALFLSAKKTGAKSCGGMACAMVRGQMCSFSNPFTTGSGLRISAFLQRQWKSIWLFWSLMGGMVNCFLDVLPAVVAGALLTGSDLLISLVWVPLIVSVDFYATNVGAFIGLSVPVSAGKTIKQVVQIMFVYFGLLPDIAAAALGIVFGHMVIGMTGAAVLNFGLGFLFFGLSPPFY